MADKIRCQFDLVVGTAHYYFATWENYAEEAAKPPKIWDGSITVEIEEQDVSNMKPIDAFRANLTAAEAALDEEVQKRWPGMKHTIYYWWWLKGENDGG
jgi:hypothetical protein